MAKMRVQLDNCTIFGEVEVPDDMDINEAHKHLEQNFKNVVWGDPIVTDETVIEVDLPIPMRLPLE